MNEEPTYICDNCGREIDEAEAYIDEGVLCPDCWLDQQQKAAGFQPEGIGRFREFLREHLKEIAAEDSGWEYEDGTPMQQDATAFRAFLAEQDAPHNRTVAAEEELRRIALFITSPHDEPPTDVYEAVRKYRDDDEDVFVAQCNVIDALKAELAAVRKQASWQLLAEGGLTTGDEVVWCDGLAKWVGHWYDETGVFEGYEVMGRVDEAPFYFRLPDIPAELFQRLAQARQGEGPAPTADEA